MEALLHDIARDVALAIEAIAIAIIAIGTVETLFGMVRVLARPHATGEDRRAHSS